MRLETSIATLVAAALALGSMGGCANMTETQKGTATGAAIGAAAGTVIGAAAADKNKTRAGATGAAVGAAVGAIGGYVWSKKMEEQKKAMEANSRGTGIDVSRTPDNRLKLNIPADAGFATNRAEITPGLRTVLDRFAGTMNEHTVTTIQIVGHTDATGTDKINDPLSIARANSTRDYLAGRGVAAARMATAGRGEREPVATNDTAAGRAQNRRVEIYIAEAAPQ